MTASSVTSSAPICVASTQRGDEAGDASLDSHSQGTPSTACCTDESASDTNYVKSVEWYTHDDFTFFELL